MRIGLLGPVSVTRDDGTTITVAGARLRALLAMLALQPRRPVGPDRLVAGLWGDEPPAGATNALQSLVSRLRRALTETGHRSPVTSVPAGYQLDIDNDAIDTHRFTTLVADGHRRRLAGDTAGAVDTVETALRLWRGPALADVTAPFADPVVTRLTTDRLDALAELAEAYLAAGRAGAAATLLAEPGSENPHSERLCALRIRALHGAGRQAEALACYERTRHALADDLGVDPSADLAAVHLAVLRGDTADPPPAEARRTNLRAALSSFIGRDREIAEIRKLLTDTRLVTLVGPGGAGKTRLAAEAAAGLNADHHDDVWFVELAPVADPADIPNAALTALGAQAVLSTSTRGASGTVTDRAEQLRTTLADRRALLVLDNCEHLIDAVARLADTLLSHCPGIRILATSRAALSITGEQLYPVPPLEAPAAGADLTTTRASAAVRLLTDRAAAVRPGFTVTDDNRDAIGAICRGLDGAPLALELAAARLRALTPTELADRLDDRFRILTGGNRAALPRHQTLRAVVSWSWDLLREPERVLARRLSVFPGGATLPAAEATCADPPADAANPAALLPDAADPAALPADAASPAALPADSVLDALTGLIDQSLVEADDRPATRYRMLETIRAYSAEQLTAAGETHPTRRAHLAYYLHLAETTEPTLRTRDQDRAMACFTAEHDNMIAALRHAVDTHDTESGLRLGAALIWYWVLLGYAADGGHWLREVIRIAPDDPPDHLAGPYVLCNIGAQLNDIPQAFTEPEEIAPRVARLERLAARAVADGHPNPLLRLFRVFPPAIRGDNQAISDLLDALVTDDDPWVRASSTLLRAHMLRDTTNIEESSRDAETAVTAFRDIGEHWGLSMALVGLGEHLVMTGEVHRAADVLAEAWQVASNFIPEPERPSFLIRLASIRVRAGDLDAAERDLAQARAMAPTVRPANRFDWFQDDLIAADIHRRRGRTEQARASFRAVLDFSAAHGVTPPQIRAVALAGLAAVEHDAGDNHRAATLFTDALRALAPSRDLPVLATLLHGAIVLAAADGDHERSAVLSGAVDTWQRHVVQHDPELNSALAAARTALGDTAFHAAARRGADLDFVGVYDYLGVPAGTAGPMARPDRPPTGAAGQDGHRPTPSGGTPG